MIEASTMTRSAIPDGSPLKRVLNTGSGPASPERLHQAFSSETWTEVRLDINPAVEPDILGSVGDMRGLIDDASFDAIWSSHNIEHLYAFEIVPALREFCRVLKPDGFALITCPDIAAVARFILDRGLDVPAYNSAAGPITPLDMLYGHGRSIAEGDVFMSHKSAFTEDTLGKVALQAGFTEARVFAGDTFDLWALLLKPRTDRLALRRFMEKTRQADLVD